MYNLSSQVKSSQVKSSQVNLLRFFLGALIALSVLVCGTAFADLMYVKDSGTITQIVDAQGTSRELDIEAKEVLPFTHNGSPHILVLDSSSNIAVYNLENLSAPLASGTLSDLRYYDSDTAYVAELGSNIVIAYKHLLFEVTPETCEIVNTYDPSSNYQNGDEDATSVYPTFVYPYGGQIVVGFMGRIVTMDKLGHITGTFSDFEVNGALEASGGELYFALGDEYYTSPEAVSLIGIYRVSSMLGNMNYHNAVRVTTDNPCQMTRDGKGGLYYTVWNSEASVSSPSSHPRYIYHWDGTSSSQVYDAGSGSNNGVEDIQYDIKNGILYARICNSGYSFNLTALAADGSGQLTASQTFGTHDTFAVMGNPADSSSGNTVYTYSDYETS